MSQDFIAYGLVGLAALFLIGKACGFWNSKKACCKKDARGEKH